MKMSQKCEQFSYGTFGGIFLGFLVPLRASPWKGGHRSDNIYRPSPPDLGGGMFANILPGGTFASFWLKFNQKLANVLLYAKYNILYQKYINKMTFASF